MSQLYQINLMPTEPLLFGDNRSARMGADHFKEAKEPSPLTLFGAIGSYISSNLKAVPSPSGWKNAEPYLGVFKENMTNEKQSAELLGYCLRNSEGLWFPKPAHFSAITGSQGIRAIKQIYKLIAKDVNSPSSMELPYYLAGKPNTDETEQDVLITLQTLKSCLSGVNPDAKNGDKAKFREEFSIPEQRRGIQIENASNTTKQHMLFSKPYKRYVNDFKYDQCVWISTLYNAWYKTLEPLPGHLQGYGTAFFGGDRRRAKIEISSIIDEKPLLEMREKIKSMVSTSLGFFVYLLTPSVRIDDWPTISNHRPIAVITGKEIIISGWNSNRAGQQPRPMLKLIPAGSTIFYLWPTQISDQDKKDIIHQNWFESICKPYQYAGFGRILMGVWR